VCPLDCPDSCGIVAKVVAGRVESLTGDPDHPYTKGFICKKMRRYPERVYSPDRILHPQVRIGQKGEAKFERISWPDALGLLSEKLTKTVEQYGGEAILPYQYAGNMGVLNRNGGYGLYHKLGASRLIETICSAAAGKGWSMHYGDVPGSPPEVAADSELIIAWGINVKVSNVHFWPFIAAARKKGARLIVIDPYRNETAQSADQYIQVQPGGDSALALGALKYLVEANRIDRKILDEQTTDFEALQGYLQATPWEQFTQQSGLDKETIAAFARLLAQHPKTFIRIGIGLSRNSRGGMSVRAISALGAALGLFSGMDGQGVLMSAKAFSGDTDKLRFPELAEKKSRLVNMAHLGHALTALQPPVKLFFVYSSNPLSVAPDSSMVRQGLMRDDLFTVVHEQVMTPTARYADLLLPATTFLENKDLYTGYGHFIMGCVDRVIEPVGEARSNFDLFQDLARTMGLTDAPFNQTAEERLQQYVATMEGLPQGYVFNPDEFSGWIESTRKRTAVSVMQRWDAAFAFKAVVEDAAAEGVPAIPCLLEADEFSDKDLCSRLPLKLITPPHRDLLNSTFGDLYRGKIGEVLIHPKDAALHKIVDGAQVLLENQRGKSVRLAKITEDTQEGLLVAEGLFWQTDEYPSAINDLTSQKTTDVAAGPTFHESRVSISPVTSNHR
jgi:anaerobic selenocysteine-containing dehydrogenase